MINPISLVDYSLYFPVPPKKLRDNYTQMAFLEKIRCIEELQYYRTCIFFMSTCKPADNGITWIKLIYPLQTCLKSIFKVIIIERAI